MSVRYRAGLTLTWVLIVSLTCTGIAHAMHARHRHHETRSLPAQSASADLLYSRRALRRARIILQLKLLELHRERLDRVRKAVEHALPIDALLDDH